MIKEENTKIIIILLRLNLKIRYVITFLLSEVESLTILKIKLGDYIFLKN